ncbi:unnamed protein product [Euphydryas editha]|uniref:CCHC-type domain-containing protein n=1 Tax=Euphydryas editha TaxID=104508 RepID=A0AAU9V010_EUPED|nr:unnamed protein product [Euphydryas editha]
MSSTSRRRRENDQMFESQTLEAEIDETRSTRNEYAGRCSRSRSPIIGSRRIYTSRSPNNWTENNRENRISRERSLERRLRRRNYEQNEGYGLQRQSRSHEQRGRDTQTVPDCDHQKLRSRSPSFTVQDVIQIVNSLKAKEVQPSAQTTSNNKNVDHQNILPNFNPSTKNQRIDIWLRKVNECASVYGWDERTTTHFAMQKLQGLAKTWYEGLNSILFTWQEWQDKLLAAFPCEQNYGQIKEDMLKRKSKFNEPIEVYYYEKLTLLNQCDISGKRAVDCIIHGISDKMLKSSALALRCSYPEQLLQYLMSNKDMVNLSERSSYRNRQFNETNRFTSNHTVSTNPNPIFCFNCKEKGHPYLQCPKPLIRCNRCNKIGHKTESCFMNADKRPLRNEVPSTMCITDSKISSKFIKSVTVNGKLLDAFIDFGSEVSLIKKTVALQLGVKINKAISFIRGFGNELVQSTGNVVLDILIDDVKAKVTCKVVTDNLLDTSLLIGQSFTEQCHVIVYKDANRLNFFDIGKELPFSNTELKKEDHIKIRIAKDVEIYGETSVKTLCKPTISGDIVLNSKVLGKPNQQYIIKGGIYAVKKGLLFVTVLPYIIPCLLMENALICRTEKVELVNQIIETATRSTPSVQNTRIKINEIKIGENVTENDKLRLIQMLVCYEQCFATSLKELGCTNVSEMNIEIKNKQPVVYRPYRLSHHERETVQKNDKRNVRSWYS